MMAYTCLLQDCIRWKHIHKSIAYAEMGGVREDRVASNIIVNCSVYVKKIDAVYKIAMDTIALGVKLAVFLQ